MMYNRMKSFSHVLKSAPWIFALLVCATVAHAQEGTIRYDQTVKIHYELPEEVRNMEGFDELMETFSDFQISAFPHVMHFSATASLMRLDEEFMDSLKASLDPMAMMSKLEDVDPGKMMAIGMAVMNSMDTESMMNLNNVPIQGTYTNFDEGEYVQERDILTRRFRVTGPVQPPTWKLSDEERSFLDYRILKASATVDTLSLEAWYAPDILVPAGPHLYGGLPGLVLILNLKGTTGTYEETYTARSIDLTTSPDFLRPETGKEVTAEEFAEILTEKNKEIQDSFSRIRNMNFDY